MLLAVMLLASAMLFGCRDASGPEIEEEEMVTVQEFGEVYIADEKDSLEELTSRADVVVVDFSAAWCGPCKMLAPKLDEMAAEYSSVYFVSADADKCRKAVEQAGQVLSLPCVVIYTKGKEAGRVIGFSPAKIRAEIDRAVKGEDE